MAAPLVFITGASSGIGQAMAWRFYQAGWRLALVARRTGEIDRWAAEKGLKLPAFFQPVRFALSGEVHGADLFDVMVLLGAESVLRRLEAGANRLAAA